MQLYRHANGYWYVRYSRAERPPHGALASLKTRDPDRARLEFDELQKLAYEERLHALQRAKTITLGDFAQRYCAERPEVSDATLRMDRLALSQLQSVTGAARSVATIGAADLACLVRACRARGLAAASINTYLRHIGAALNAAVEAGYLRRAPKMPYLRSSRQPKPLTVEQVNQILIWCDAHNRELARIVRFAVNSGCRASEILALTWDRVTTSGATWWACILGKGNQERSIPITDQAQAAMGSPPAPGDDGSRHVHVFARQHPNTLSHRFKAAARAAGVPEAHFHRLRHTTATYMLAAGISPIYVQMQLGHADFATTRKYTRIADAMLAAEMRKFKQIGAPADAQNLRKKVHNHLKLIKGGADS